MCIFYFSIVTNSLLGKYVFNCYISYIIMSYNNVICNTHSGYIVIQIF